MLAGTVHGGVESERLKEIQADFEAPFHCYERHICPISSWVNEAVEHWTLLVLETTTKKVRCYEAVEKLKGRNFDAAGRIREIAGFEGKVERVNKVKQEGVEFGESLCHYAELELRGGDRRRLGVSSRIHQGAPP